jgi:hypothetical protein
MKKMLVLLFMLLFIIPLVMVGCGSKQEAVSKPLATKAPETAAKDADKEEESDVEEPSPANEGVKEAATVQAADKGTAVQEAAKVVETPKVEIPAVAEEVVIADFDSGEKPNNLGGNFGAWNKDPSDATQWCKENFDNATKHGDKGFSMKLDYSVQSTNPAYNGFWMMLPNFDASKYDNLIFWVKGDPKEGFTTVFKVELKNNSKQVGRFYVSNVGDQWQQISIPLSEFKGLGDRSNMTELVIVFEDRMASNKKGTIYLDDFKFTKNK